MKFARYLQDTQTPEWKKAYMQVAHDYKGLKKLITAIKKSQDLREESEPFGDEVESPRPSPSLEGQDPVQGRRSLSSQASASGFSRYGSTGITPPLRNIEAASPMPSVELPDPILPSNQSNNSNGPAAVRPASRSITSSASPYIQRPRANRSVSEVACVPQLNHSQSTGFGSRRAPGQPAEQSTATSSPGFLSTLRRRHTIRSQRTDNLGGGVALPLSVILPALRPIERKFIEKLDEELEKVEKFYLNRESEALQQAAALDRQLRELEEHRRLFHEAKEAETTWKSILVPHSVANRLHDIPRSSVRRGGNLSPVKDINEINIIHSDPSSQGAKGVRSRSTSPNNTRSGLGRARLDPDEYKNAKKNIRKAVLEYYKFLELLNNYRVLNVTGFRKALKKFEKTINIPQIQQAYMREKVEVSAFATAVTVEKLLREIEDQYAQSFEHGNTKKARERLRASMSQKSHHFSTFRTGLYLGLAIPALADGVYRSFQPGVRASLPWGPLLYVYATFLVPSVFALLVGINIWIWNRSRINYQFIFELDVRTQLDSREYFELPAFLLSTLIYAFWLSFARIGVSNIAPTTWPIAWLVFALLVLFNPLPILFPSSRWWLIRKVGKLFLSGTQPVEFADFWLGDQFCSLIFTLSNLYFVGCVYAEDWQDPFNKCNASLHWVIPLVLAILPLAARTLQSIKRYVDSRLYTHLINAGKYSSSIIYYVFYYLWRHHNRNHDFSLVLFCFFGTVSSIYTSAWDILMDWSLFKRPAQHRFLRKDIVYQSHYQVYYFVIITNILARFQWIIYLADANDDFRLRTFIVGMLEMLRRFQWNFFRLENEHIGNTDQYRVTREVPLPYNFDRDGVEDKDSDEEEEERNSRFSVRSRVWRQHSVRMEPLSSGDDEPPYTTSTSRQPMGAS